MSCPEAYTAGGVETFHPEADSNRPVGRAPWDLLLIRYLTVTFPQV